MPWELLKIVGHEVQFLSKMCLLFVCLFGILLTVGFPPTGITEAASIHGAVTSREQALQENGVASKDLQQELVHIFDEIEKLIEQKQHLQHKKEEEELVDYFYEDDIMLTIPQAQRILHDKEEEQEHRKRKKRKLAEPLAKRWATPIPYVFDGTHNTDEKYRIRQALSYWEELTCIRFTEDRTAMHKLMFSRGKGCWSYVGYTHQVNQTISIGDGCQSNGTIAHEVGHAIGFWHEQSRPDRDDYININKYNVTQGKLYNFDKRTWGEIVTLDIPYDLGSDMHYGSKFYSKDANSTLATVETRDQLMMRVIGQRQELSFYDTKLANKAYCEDICSDLLINLTQPCMRDGYQDPKNCHKCRCPDGFGGDFCERPAEGKIVNCGGKILANTNGTIYSPGYPNGYVQNSQCSWLIQAPEGSHVYLQFTGPFGLSGHEDVCKDYVEVRYNSSLALTGARFCIDDAPRFPIRSASNEMMVLFRSFDQPCDDNKYPWKCQTHRVGFRANYFTKSCGGCHGNGQDQTACVKRVSYACHQSWEEKVKIDCPSWWYTDGCGMQSVTKTRYATCYRDDYYCCATYILQGTRCKRSYLSSSGTPNQQLRPIHRPSDSDNTGGDPRYTGHHSPNVYYPSYTPPPPPPVMQVWSEWSEWGPCNVQCGGGISVRTRTCLLTQYCNAASRIQADKKPCQMVSPCYQKCAVEKRILCELWTTCTRTVYEKCNPFCLGGYTLQGTVCVPASG